MEQESDFAVQDQEIHLRDYFLVLRKRKWTIITCFLLVVISTAVFSLTATPIYKATSRLIIEKENPNVLSIEEVMAVDSSGTDYYQTQYKIIESRKVAREVIHKLNLARSEEFSPSSKKTFVSQLKQDIKQTLSNWKQALFELLNTPTGQKADADAAADSDLGLVQSFIQRINVEPIRNSRLVDVGFEAKDPALAAEVANTLTRSYIEQNLETKLNAAKNAVQWLHERIDEQRQKVETAEHKLQAYKEKQGIVTGFSSENEQITAQKLAEINKQVIEAEAKRVEAETRYEQVQQLKKSAGQLDSISAILNDVLIRGIKQSEVELSKRLSELSGRYGPNHPKIKALKSELRTLKQRKRSEITKITKSIESEYEVALARERSLKQSLSRLKQEAYALNLKAIDYGVLKREAESARQMYELLVKRFKEASLTEDIKTGNIRIIDKAEVPRGPIKPNTKRNLLLALVLGLMLGIGLAFFLEYLDNTIKNPDDVKKYLGIPYLAPVPFFSFNPQQEPSALIALQSPKASASEAYRGLRTSLLYSAAESPPQVIMVSSAGPREGKSLTSSNLAVTMAQFGSRVLLVDCDLRRPRLHRLFDLERDQGLTNILTGSAQTSSVVMKTSLDTLQVLASGPLPPNPSELLGSKRMNTLIKSMRTHYDRIIFDSPPVTAVTDASVLSQVVDGTILVIRAGVTTKDLTRNALESLQQLQTKVLGTVLNGVDMKRESYYYYQYYYYYYGEDGERKTKKRRKKQPTPSYG